MGKKRPDRGAEGTGRRAGVPPLVATQRDSERSRAWEVDLRFSRWQAPGAAFPPALARFLFPLYCHLRPLPSGGEAGAAGRGAGEAVRRRQTPSISL